MAVVNNSLTERLIIIAMMACFSMIFLSESGAIAVTFCGDYISIRIYFYS